MEILLLLVDALNLIRRVYAAQPGPDGPARVEGAREACVRSLRRALRETGPTHAACVFEGEGASWRHERHPGYKAGRAPMPGPLREGLPGFREAFGAQGVRSVSFPGLEADDVAATLACKVAERGGRVTILSTDKVFLQLISPRIGVRDHFQQAVRDEAFVRARFGVGPGQLVDFLALTGDGTNNIPGVPGVGPKRAAELLGEFATLEEVLASAPRRGDRLGEALQRHRDAALLARDLVRLRTDLRLGLNLQTFRVSG